MEDTQTTTKTSTRSKGTTAKAHAELVAATSDKYKSFGWQVLAQPKGGINDLIAQKGNKLHFIQVVTQSSDDRYTGTQKSSFVQNALSNKATPIHASESSSGKLVTQDVNTNARVIIGQNKKAGGASVDTTNKV